MAAIFVNGKEYSLTDGQADKTLLVFLREQGLTGTKLGCGEGGCGACTVMLSRKCTPDAPVLHMAVNACLCPLYAAAGCHVITVEGIGNPRDGLHPVQEQLANAHGSQCGFCTPGFVMSMYALLRSADGKVSEHDIEDALAGNLCRCTGYRPILDAFRPFTEVDSSMYTDAAIQKRVAGAAAPNGAHKGSNGVTNGVNGTNGTLANGTNGRANGSLNSSSDDGTANGTNGKAHVKICPSTGKPCGCGDAPKNGSNSVLEQLTKGPPCEPIFPPKLASGEHKELHFTDGDVAWHRPLALPQLLALAKQHPKCKFVGGNTEVGIEMNIAGAAYAVLIDPTLVPELAVLQEEAPGLRIGGAVSLTRIMNTCKALQKTRAPHEAPPLKAICDQLQWFAGVQIRNVATLAGNIVTGSPISDLNPVWVAMGATFVVESAEGGQREVAAGDFFQGYRKVDLKPGEVLTSVLVPWAREHEFVAAFKQAHRKEDDIALVNAGMRMHCVQQGGRWAVSEVSLAYGGVGPKVVVAERAQAALRGQPLSKELLQEALGAIKKDITVPEGAPGGMGAFRTALAASFYYKFALSACASLADATSGSGGQFGWLGGEEMSALSAVAEGVPRGVQFHADAKPNAIVGQAERHRAAHLQVCGEAQYTGDAPLPDNALHAALVTSTQPHAKLLSVDASAALALPGAVAYFSADDVPGDPNVGPNFADEEMFAKDEVTCVGHPIGVILADTHKLAMKAAAAVKVEYEPLEAIMTIDDAVAAGSFMTQYERDLHYGDVDAAFGSDKVAVVIEGAARMGGQEHFYLEPQCNYVVPIEDDEFLLVASTQDVNKHHKLVSRVLGIPQHKLTCKTKRLGGGFGGKETRGAFLHCATAIAAYHTRRPVRLALDRQHDMRMTGHRHAFKGAYKVAADKEGRVLAVDLKLYNNAGNSMDLSHAVLDRGVLHSDGTYKVPNFRIHARICKTNQASNTAYRGFGGPQGMLVANMWMSHLAAELGLPYETIQERNMYTKADPECHFTQVCEPERIWACWNGAMESAGWAERRAAVDAFNAGSRYRKRGLAALATKFGISFTFQPMNQAGATVSVYLDGSVSLVHGGIEMGQGLHTKMCQVAAQELGVPLAAVHVAETSTDKIPNSSPTAASASSDLYGAAIVDACAQLNARLAPIREKLGPRADMHEVANQAWMDRVDLCAHGFYKTPDITGARGDMPFNYFVYGAAVAEVEVDCLTGDWHNLRTDVVMDIGNPINPSIDIGQVEGGFVQGVGWAALEELKWGDKAHPWIKPGLLLTNGPGNYKIPTAQNIPRDFRVHLLENMANKRAVHSSKAVGEPPFHLGASVLFALKDAIASARKDAGLTGFFALDAPATPERIRMACVDHLTGKTAADYRPLLSC